MGVRGDSDPIPAGFRTGSKQGLTPCEIIAAWVVTIPPYTSLTQHPMLKKVQGWVI